MTSPESQEWLAEQHRADDVEILPCPVWLQWEELSEGSGE